MYEMIVCDTSFLIGLSFFSGLKSVALKILNKKEISE